MFFFHRTTIRSAFPLFSILSCLRIRPLSEPSKQPRSHLALPSTSHETNDQTLSPNDLVSSRGSHKCLTRLLLTRRPCSVVTPYVANFFFVKKKDGKLRPVQDYRPINKWTRRNQNISPLIPQVIDRLRGCTLFTKVDVRWGYNNIRIKEGDEWKAAFLTPEGLFEPTIMFFGLTNSPATFQMMMNTIFRTEVAQGWLSVYMNDIAIHTKCESGEMEQQHLERH